jgi:hypothetical protein
MERIVTLRIKKIFFDRILSGEKKSNIVTLNRFTINYLVNLSMPYFYIINNVEVLLFESKK